MSYYVVNRLTGGRVHLLQNSIKLAPKGTKGDSRRIPDWARSHPDVLTLEKGGKIEVLSESQYRERLGKPAKPVAKDVVAPVTAETVKAVEPEPEPVVEEPAPAVAEPEPEPTPVEESEVVEEPEEAPEESTPTDLISLADFKQLNKTPQLNMLKELGVYEDSHADKKSNAESAYEAYLAAQD
jgi:hypothetical protein